MERNDMKNIAVILAGCGVFDGSEINEVVLTLLHIEKNNAQYQCFAPDIEQYHTINHITGEEIAQQRNVLVESARITRGNIKSLAELDVTQFDALIVPGGFGVAKNLSDFAINGTNAKVNEAVLSACKAFADAKKATGYMCIAPALLPFIYHESDTAEALSTLGAEHVECKVDDIVIDKSNKLVTTPAYMLAQSIMDADAGIDKLVRNVLAMS